MSIFVTNVITEKKYIDVINILLGVFFLALIYLLFCDIYMDYINLLVLECATPQLILINDRQRQNTSTPTPSPQPGPLRLRNQDRQDNNTSSLRLSPVSSTDMTQDTYSDVLQKPGEWQQINRRKNIKSKIKGHGSVSNLKGIKYERSVTLYVRNISVCDNETEQSITFQVKSYVKRKDKNNNIRIMRMNVV